MTPSPEARPREPRTAPKCIAFHPLTDEPCGLAEWAHFAPDGSMPGHRFIAPGTAYCAYCDGVGWNEGGVTIKTTCTACGGEGWAR